MMEIYLVYLEKKMQSKKLKMVLNAEYPLKTFGDFKEKDKIEAYKVDIIQKTNK